MDERRAFFDRHAASWEERLTYGEKRSQLSEVVQWFGLSEGDLVLDVGTGTGVLLPWLREAVGPKGVVVGMDFSFRMLEEARSRSRGERTDLVNASVLALPLPAGRFNRLTCFSAFPHFPDKNKALVEMVRVLARGGRLCLAHLHSVEEINAFHRGVGGEVGDDRLPLPEELEGMMVSSGLGKITIVNQPGRFLAQGTKV